MAAINTHTTLQSRPAEGLEPKPTSVQWYQPTIKQLNPDVVKFFQGYVGLRDTEEILSHIYAIREQAWQVYVCPRV